VSGSVEFDPDELDRGASALSRSQSALASEAKAIRGAVAGMSRFRGWEADKFRAQIDQQARQLTAHADALGKSAQMLRSMAQDIRSLRWR
jgi:uncharacterized protein YukE